MGATQRPKAWEEHARSVSPSLPLLGTCLFSNKRYNSTDLGDARIPRPTGLRGRCINNANCGRNDPLLCTASPSINLRREIYDLSSLPHASVARDRRMEFKAQSCAATYLPRLFRLPPRSTPSLLLSLFLIMPDSHVMMQAKMKRSGRPQDPGGSLLTFVLQTWYTVCTRVT